MRVAGKFDEQAPHEIMLVLDASLGQNALAQARQFSAAVGVSGITLTKLDGGGRGGILLAIASELDIPFRFILAWVSRPTTWRRSMPDKFVDALLEISDGQTRMIRFDSVSKRYDGTGDALRNLSFEVDKGEMVFLTGTSGAGKSTLLKLIALIERPTRGQVFVDGRNIGRLPPREIPKHRRQLGVVFQDNKLLTETAAPSTTSRCRWSLRASTIARLRAACAQPSTRSGS